MPTLLVAEPRLTWNLVDDVRHLFDFPFMINAFRAGTLVALTAGAVGWFMVLRRQSFAGHTLAVIGFPGAAAAVYLGISTQLGFFSFCLAGALVIALVPVRGGGFSDESAVIAVVQAFALACGFLFVSLHGGNLNRINALLFGSLLGVTNADVLRELGATVVALVAIGVLARPLLFASVDPDVAAARGVPVRGLSMAFMVLLGLAAAASTQITGALLVFALLVLPSATARAVTARPMRGLLLATALAVVVTWLGLACAYYSPYPVGFWITTIGFGIYLLAVITTRPTRRVRVRPS